MENKLTVTLKPCLKDREGDEGWLGGDARNPDWDEYVAGFVDEWRPRLECLKEWILSQDPYPCADEICNDYHFEFSDGSKFSCSWRAWGDLVQAAVGKREGYMTYYMRGFVGDDRKWTAV